MQLFSFLDNPATAKALQSCLTLCDPMDWSPPGSSIHRIFQARVLEWGAIAFSSAQRIYLKNFWTIVGSIVAQKEDTSLGDVNSEVFMKQLWNL